MRRVIITSLIFGYALLLSGCSFFADVVVVNQSGSNIKIFYKAIHPYYKSLEPQMSTLSEFNVNKTEWKEFPIDKYKLDLEKGTVEVQLAPGEILRMFRMDSSRAEDDLNKEMDLAELKIEGEKGLIELKGDNISKQFKPEHRSFVFYGPSLSRYVLYYK